MSDERENAAAAGDGANPGGGPVDRLQAAAAELERLQQRWADATGVGDEDEPGELEFPERTRSDETTVSRKHKFHAWVGTPERLTRISDHVDDALRRAFMDAKPELEKQPKCLAKSAAERFVPHTTVRGGSIERTGDTATILSDMDARDIEWLQITNTDFGHSSGRAAVTITFGREPKYRSLGGGVTVEVTGPDKQWVAGTFHTLVTEVGRDVPWWSRAISDAAWFGYIGVAFLASVVFVLWALPAERVAEAGAPLVTLMGLFGGSALFFATRKWLLPDFDLVEPGGRSRARRVGTSIVGFVSLIAALVTIWAFMRG